MKKTYWVLAVVLCCALLSWGICSFALPVRYESQTTVELLVGHLPVPKPVNQEVLAEEVEALKKLEIAEAVGMAEHEIGHGLSVRSRPSSNLIDISFRHSDPGIPIPVLDELLRQYMKDFVMRQRESSEYQSLAEAKDRAQMQVVNGKLDPSVLQGLEKRLQAETEVWRSNRLRVHVIMSPTTPAKVRWLL